MGAPDLEHVRVSPAARVGEVVGSERDRGGQVTEDGGVRGTDVAGSTVKVPWASFGWREGAVWLERYFRSPVAVLDHDRFASLEHKLVKGDQISLSTAAVELPRVKVEAGHRLDVHFDLLVAVRLVLAVVTADAVVAVPGVGDQELRRQSVLILGIVVSHCKYLSFKLSTVVKGGL